MSTIAALARVRAAVTGRAQLAATVRHRHLADRPLVLVPYALAGEAFAPLAAMVGTGPDDFALLVVPQPRDRARRFAFAAELAGHVLPYLEGFAYDTETVEPRGGEAYERALDAPQVLVPTAGGVEWIGMLGRSTRFRRTEGEYAVAPGVPLLGRWCTFLADRAAMPGSSTVLAITDLLTRTWVTGQSSLEDGDLAALLGWIDPEPGRTGAETARAVEGTTAAGPLTDPRFDVRLAPLVAAHDAAVRSGDPAAVTAAEAAVREALEAEMAPTWRRAWRAVELLREIAPGASVAGRWEADRAAYSFFAADVADPASRPQPRVPGAVAAAAQLGRRESAQARLEAEELRDDPLLMAEARLRGEAFRGPVVEVDAERTVAETGKRPRPRPLLTIATGDEPLMAPGTDVACVERPEARARVVEVEASGGKNRVVLELRAGMGGGKVPKEGSVPAEGEVLCWTSVIADFHRAPAWPAPEATPWTHGGPPLESGDDPRAPQAADDTEPDEEWA